MKFALYPYEQRINHRVGIDLELEPVLYTAVEIVQLLREAEREEFCKNLLIVDSIPLLNSV